MIRKRGAPVLVELIKRSPTGVPSSAESVAPYATRETPRIPTTTGSLADSASWSPASRRARQNLMMWAIWVSAAIVVLVLGLWIGNYRGKKTSDQHWADKLSSPSGLAQGQGGTPPPNVRTNLIRDPLDQPALPPSGEAGGSMPPANRLNPNNTPTSTDIPVVTEIQAGWNYLVVATLPWKEAVEAAQYLARGGYPASVVPKNRVDPGRAEANNTPCEVVLLSGYAPGEYREAQKDREALMTKVKGLGRRWRADNRRAPSDFSDAFWKKF